MRHLLYTNYESGNSGLSNAIMSIEIGVVLAFLTNRFLVLDGNVSPPANLVSYGGRVNNERRSRVTDLIDLPVPWSEPGEIELSSVPGQELADRQLMDSVFYLPGTVDIGSADAHSFARGRNRWLCETEAMAQLPVLKVSEDPVSPKPASGPATRRCNLGFYSYFFYFDNETRRSTYQMLQRMQAKKPYAELARRVAADLGTFNAVHMRRGDFKVTYGVTVLDRQPWEAIDAMEKHFSRNDRLLICTDERDDPFFDELKSTWADHLFIDHHILDHYGAEFAQLPQHDNIALAYLSQLVAAESQDFIGTMTSTFTSMIQRYRGNRGKAEPFKFLWNELPEPGERSERGRHPVSECIPLDNGVMIEQFEGPYSWNRYSPLLNPAWMREWPESFLTETVLETGALAQAEPLTLMTSGRRVETTEALLLFEGLRVRITSSVPGLAFRLSEMFHRGERNAQGSVIAEFEIAQAGAGFSLSRNGQVRCDVSRQADIPAALVNELVPILTHARKQHSWLPGMVFEQAGRTFLYTGDTGSTDDAIADALCSAGWELLADTAIPVKAKSREVVPFARCSWPRGASARITQSPRHLDAIVHGSQRLHSKDAVAPLSPAVAAAELIGQSRDFAFDRERAVERLCALVEQIPAFELSFSGAARVPRLLGFLATMERRPPAVATVPGTAA